MYLKHNEKSLFDNVETRKTDVFLYRNIIRLKHFSFNYSKKSYIEKKRMLYKFLLIQVFTVIIK